VSNLSVTAVSSSTAAHVANTSKSLYVKQFVDESLGNSSYLIADEASGEAAVIDPQRDVEKYVQSADGLGLKLKYALDSHLHADFISGAHELAHQLGVPHQHERSFQIGASAAAEAEFEHIALQHGDRLALGNLSLGILSTPGHTPEHISFAVYAEDNEIPEALFSGGSLIVGGTGRPDLLGHEHTIPLARDLFHSIHEVISRLPDDVVVYPTHGAGSFCNTTSSGARFTTIGQERRTNPFFQLTDEEAFVKRATTGLSSYPTYYGRSRAINQQGPRLLGGVPLLRPLAPDALQKEIRAGAAVIDIRPSRQFIAGHIPNSYGIPLVTPLTTWAGWVVPFGTPIVLVANTPEERQEAVLQLIRIGYDDLRGYLAGGLDTWGAAGFPLAHWHSLSARDLNSKLRNGEQPFLLDVRYNKEWAQGHIAGARHVEAGQLPEVARAVLPDDRPLVLYCARGNRSTVALSVLEQKGFRDLYALEDGISSWLNAGYETVQGGE
jgi:hydroxyacylglutathione hydrolase